MAEPGRGRANLVDPAEGDRRADARRVAQPWRRRPDVISFFGPAVLALILQHLAVTLDRAVPRPRAAHRRLRPPPRLAGQRRSRSCSAKVLAFGILGAVVAAVVLALLVYVLHAPVLGDSRLVALSDRAASWPPRWGSGCSISVVSDSERQAVQLALLVLLGSVFFSGFVLDLDQFAPAVQAVGNLLPVTHGIRLLQDLMLRGSHDRALAPRGPGHHRGGDPGDDVGAPSAGHVGAHVTGEPSAHRHRRPLGWGLIAYGAMGVLLLVASVAVAVGPLASVARIAAGRGDAIRWLDLTGRGLDDVGRVAANAGTSLTSAATAARDAASLSLELSVSMNSLRDSSRVSILGAQPLAGLADSLDGVARRSRDLSASMIALAGSLDRDASDVAALSVDAVALRGQARSLREALAAPASVGAAASAAWLVPAAWVFAIWLATPAVVSLVAGIWILRAASLKPPRQPRVTVEEPAGSDQRP